MIRTKRVTSILFDLRHLPKYILMVKSRRVYLTDLLGLRGNGEIEKIVMSNGISLYFRAGRQDRIPVNNIIIKNCYMLEANRVRDASTVIDIGAHIGVFALFISFLAPRAYVYSYEPDADSYELLRRNIEVNGLSNRIKAYNFAVGSFQGEAKFYTNPVPITNTLLGGFDQPAAHVTKIKVTTLRDVLENNRIEQCDILKINAEGSEYEILMNTDSECLAKIDSIYMQCHYVNSRLNISTMEKFLHDKGFITIGKHLDQLTVMRAST